MKIFTIVGARPQFVKAAMVSRAIAAHNANPAADLLPTAFRPSPITEVIVHTGQHFDDNMSQVFFDELEIPKPDYNLGIGGGSHGQNTGRMIEAIENVLMDEKPDWVLVYGDTDSTLAGALAAVKLHIPVAHVEAGLRSYNRRMPEEINRVLTDHTATLLFAPTSTAIENLRREGFTNIAQNGSLYQPSQPLQPVQPSPLVINVGDVMYDAALFYAAKAEESGQIIQSLGLTPKNYVLATVHRAENTNDPQRLTAIIAALTEIARDLPVILPLHPRTRKMLETLPTSTPSPTASRPSPLACIDPLGYLDMVMLEKNAALIVTDSGGMQKEAFFHGVPCVIPRMETEWVELIELGWNRLASPDSAQAIVKVAREAMSSKPAGDARPYGKGKSAYLVVKVLLERGSVPCV
jgi:UDP-GlcNAc3NAcA epimerase